MSALLLGSNARLVGLMAAFGRLFPRRRFGGDPAVAATLAAIRTRDLWRRHSST